MATDAFDRLAESLVRGSEQSYVAYLTERFLDMLDEAVTNPDRFQVLASRSKVAAMAAWDRYRGKVTDETRSAFLEAMSGEDELLVSSLSKAYGYDRTISTRGNNELDEAARGMAEIMRRQNVALADNLADEWYKVTSDAVTGTLMGGDYRTVMEDAVSRLSDAGLETIDYRSGVRTTIDAATRRHVVSQANQARADLLNRRCDEWGCDLVMVSAHFGARPSHAEWQGKVYSRRGNDPEYPSLDYGTGYHGTGPYGALGDRLCGVNCVVEGTEVGGPLPTGAYRREYSGEVVTIRTALGHDLSVTPNHPILTPEGWVPANLLRKGGHVFSACVGYGIAPRVGPDEDEGPVKVEEEFDALGDSGEVRSLLGSSGDFHGDGIPDREVDVVLVDVPLIHDGKTERGELGPEHAPHHAHRLSGLGLSGRSLAKVIVGPLHSSDGIMGRPGLVCPLGSRHPGIPGHDCVTPALARNPHVLQPLADCHLADSESLRYPALRDSEPVHREDSLVVGLDPSPVGLEPEGSEGVGDGLRAASEMPGHLPDGGTFVVELDEVVGVDVRVWSGHVYNLETVEGWFFAGNIVTHNCLHSMTPYVPGYSQLPSTDFSEQEKRVGMTSDEYYAAKQRQRGMERRVRSLKRKVALGQERGLDMTADRYRLGRAQADLRAHCATTGLRRDYERERAYGVAQQPRGLGRFDFNAPKWRGQYPNPTAEAKDSMAGSAL